MICCDSSTLGFMHVTVGSSLFRDNATGVMNSKNRNIGDIVLLYHMKIIYIIDYFTAIQYDG